MNKKKIIFQLLEKKFVFLFATTSILIFILLLNIKNSTSKFIIKVHQDSDSIYKTQILFSNLAIKQGDPSWLNDQNLLNEFLKLFSQNNNHLKFKVKVKKEHFSSTTLLIFNRNQQFDYQVADLLNNYNDKFIEVLENKFNYALLDYEENNLIKTLVDIQIYNTTPIYDGMKIDYLKSILSTKGKGIKRHFLFLKKNKIFKFEVIANDEEQFNKEPILIIISIFSAFLINIAILIFIKNKLYNKFF
jgi:hypothetical protein